MKNKSLKILIVFCLLLFDIQGLEAIEFSEENRKETLLKTGIIYNFLKFINWPNDKIQREIKICILGEKIYLPIIEKLKSQTANGLNLNVALNIKSKDLKNKCNFLYITRGSRAIDESILSELRSNDVLIVSDVQDFSINGVMIELRNEDNKIIFLINKSLIEKTNIKLSAKLLKLAKKIY